MRLARSPRAFIAAVLALAMAQSLAPAVEAVSDVVSVIVVGRDAKTAARLTQRVGGQVDRPLPIVNGVSARVPASRIDDLSRTAYVVPDRAIKMQSASYGSNLVSAYPQEVGATSLWNRGSAGEGVTVALVDTGVTEVTDLAGRVVASANLSSEETAPRVDLRAWADLFRSPPILTLLAISGVFACAQFMVLTFIDPLLKQLGNTDADGVSWTIALYGTAGLIGSIVAARIVGPIGAFAASLIFAGAVAAGMAVWSAGAGALFAMMAGALIWGFGFTATNSLQQARLVLAAPSLSAGSIALNTSVLYIGQSVGSTIGGVLFERGQYLPIGYVATAIMVAGLGMLLMTRPRAETAAQA
jgi:subtilisin family serine protease